MKKNKQKVYSAGHEVLVHQGCEDEVFTMETLSREFERRGLKLWHRNRLYAMERQALFPARLRLGKLAYSRVCWLKSEVLAWFVERVQERPANRWKPRGERTEPELDRAS